MVTESLLLICYQRFLRESALPLPAITRIRFRLVTLLEQLWSQSTCQPQSTRNIFRNRLFLYCCNERSFSLQFLGTIWIDTSHSWTQCCFISITVNMKKIFSYSTDPRMVFLVDARKTTEASYFKMVMPYIGEKNWIVISNPRLFSWLKFMFRAKKRTFHQF